MDGFEKETLMERTHFPKRISFSAFSPFREEP